MAITSRRRARQPPVVFFRACGIIAISRDGDCEPVVGEAHWGCHALAMAIVSQFLIANAALASIGGAQDQSAGVSSPPGIAAPEARLLLAQQTAPQSSNAQRAGGNTATANSSASQTGTTAAKDQDPLGDLFSGVKKATTEAIQSVNKTTVNGIVNAVTNATNDALDKAGLGSGNSAQDKSKTTDQSKAAAKTAPAKAAPTVTAAKPTPAQPAPASATTTASASKPAPAVTATKASLSKPAAANGATSFAVSVDPGGGYVTPSPGSAITAWVEELVNVQVTVTNGKVSKPVEFPSVDGLRVTGSGNNSKGSAVILLFILTPTRPGDFTTRPVDFRTDEGQAVHVDAIRFHITRRQQ
jgi:hypothetical protein